MAIEKTFSARTGEGADPHLLDVSVVITNGGSVAFDLADQYAYLGLQQMRLDGAQRLAVLYEHYGSYFFTDLGVESARLARDVFGFDVLLEAS